LKLLDLLSTRPNSPTVTNPYRRRVLQENLSHYLDAISSQKGRRILIVGEALGYRGGRLTGIPFSSERLLREAPHPFLRRLAPQLSLTSDTAEATASIVWEGLRRRRNIPLFWNAYPFHPHRANKPDSNRAPNAAEIAEGQRFLRLIIEFYQPATIAGLGRKGTAAAEKAFPENRIVALRHPSYGGKQEFLTGFNRLMNKV
jgi:uracil-DNA glycosylase